MLNRSSRLTGSVVLVTGTVGGWPPEAFSGRLLAVPGIAVDVVLRDQALGADRARRVLVERHEPAVDASPRPRLEVRA